ncbi:sigma-54-dependent Fis family transcriptional regulator [Roseomonas frigidaquae]|uniref:Sigma-54-dependent Fis family transcriptional regulator n=1 Tax=Falsiroseomonas frigidaquae TaxID=487318 RepID=A0ABX1F8F6_9PROT|nr:sigma-54 dependent transcriptional regulator [Falsiroseomonas frigidaquae]NKE48673.1 sigma-54-dependent Fis family transcriptional regulator [Falsiroseomonas frigidaquae]
MTDLANSSVIMIEDDPVFGQALVQRLRLAGVTTHWAQTAEMGEALLRRHRPHLVLCDIRLPDGDGEALMVRLMPELGGVPVVVMTAFGGLDQAVRLLRAGADDYLAKPFPAQRVLDKLRAFAQEDRGTEDAEDLASVLDPPGWRSPPMLALQAELERVASAEATVLLTGESGVGKGVAARRLHALSGARAVAPFVVVDCAALPADTAAAEVILFGGDGAPGLVESAGAGTLFLDEVSDLPASLQARLLRLLEERRFLRIGAAEPVQTRARIVATTNADLPARVAAGTFRADLWFRLSGITLVLPPLRTRPGDLQDLARHFLRRFAKAERSFADDGMAAMLEHPWPGNVRELRNRVERAVLLADAPALAAQDLFPECANRAAPPSPAVADAPGEVATRAEPLSLAEARDAAERAHIRRVLARCGGRIGDAAGALGISRTTLWDRMRRLGVSVR